MGVETHHDLSAHLKKLYMRAKISYYMRLSDEIFLN